jgi:hypothetical protein
VSEQRAEEPSKIALLILRDEGIDWNDERAKAMFERFVAWTAELSARGVLHGVEGLMREGKTVRQRGGALVVDGPYVEGREAVLGFVAVRVRDLDAACQLAAESPYAALGGAIEVRMSSDFPKSAPSPARASVAVEVALAHIDAWSHHDWDKTRALLAPDVQARVTSTQPGFSDADLTGVESYMAPKTKAAALVEPGSVKVLSAIGDQHHALVTVTFEIGLGPGGSMVTMARSCLYALDQTQRIKAERDAFFLLSRE